MPITLPPISRRRFLQGTAALAGSAALPTLGWADEEIVLPDAHRVALFSDTHIDRDPATKGGRAGGINMTDHFSACLDQAIQGRPPAHAMVCGDCAYLTGRPGDYTQFVSLAVRLLERGVPLHCVLGNHDHTANFYEAGIAAAPEQPPVATKHVGVVETERANWVLLDSLKETNLVTGELGEAQLGWLARTLDALDDKPVLVMLHHNFDWEWRDKTDWGLMDAEALFEVVSPRDKVKALFYGHSHNWQQTRRDDGLHLVNLPPTAYVFEEGKPNGWVDCAMGEDGLALTLHCIDAEHEQHGERVELEYR